MPVSAILLLQLEVAEHRLPRPRQAKAHARDQAAAGERMLEDAVAVAEGADRRRRASTLRPVTQVDRVERLEAVLQLDAVGADVLHRRGADRAGNQRQVLQPGQPCASVQVDEVVPVLAGAGLDDPGVGALLDDAHAAHLDLEHDLRHVARQDDVAAAAEDELRRAAELRVVDDAAHVGVAGDAHQRLRHRRQAEGVVGLEAHARVDLHGRIFADPSRRQPRECHMPSFDAVLEPNLVEVRNAVEQAAKEIGTRFDFKGTSAAGRAEGQGDHALRRQRLPDRPGARRPARQADQAQRRRPLPRPRAPRSRRSAATRSSSSLIVKSGIDAETAKKMQTADQAEQAQGAGRRSRATRCASPAPSATTCRRRWR